MSFTPPKHYGAIGIGCTTRFEVEIDESLDDPNDLQMGISVRAWSFRFALTSRDQVERILAFLREYTGQLVFAEITVGSFQGAPVRLIKDDECVDRFWLRAYAGGGMVEFLLIGNDLTEFTDAVSQAVQDMQS